MIYLLFPLWFQVIPASLFLHSTHFSAIESNINSVLFFGSIQPGYELLPFVYL